MLVIIGCFNLIYGIAAIANSHVFTANAHYVFGNLRTWGDINLIISACCKSCLLRGRGGSWQPAGPLVRPWPCCGLSVIDQMFFLLAYPFWSLIIIAADVVALYALCAYGSRANLAA